MKLKINISKYDDTLSLSVDGRELQLEKGCAECEVEVGIHEISVRKMPDILGKKGKLQVIAEWFSGFCGALVNSKEEKEKAAKDHIVILNVEIKEDTVLNLKLTSRGYLIPENVECILEQTSKTEISDAALARIKRYYTVPAIILMALIGIGIFALGVALLIKQKYLPFAEVTCLLAFYAWAFSRLIKRNT